MNYATLDLKTSSAMEFVACWSKLYNYQEKRNLEAKYDNNIRQYPISEDNIRELFEWKNGIENISSSKSNFVQEIVKQLPKIKELNEIWDEAEFIRFFDPAKGAAIWNIYLMHIVNPDQNPIFDQHVYRAYRYLQSKEIKEIGYSNRNKFALYRTEYRPFLSKLQKETNCDPREIDKAMWAFGRFLKNYSKIIEK